MPLAPASWSAGIGRPPSQFMEYWKVIRGNFGRIGLLAVIGMALGWLAATLQRPMYQARTVLDIRTLNENFLNPRDGSSTGTTESVLPESYVQTEIKILQSDSIRERALERIPVPAQPLAQQSDKAFWQAPLALLRPAPEPYKNLIADAGQRIKVRAVGNTRIVEVYCDAQDGQLAASVCNTLAKTYIENNLESRYKSTKETSDWLQSQLDDVRRRLTKAENDLKDAGKGTQFALTSEIGEHPEQQKLRQLQTDLERSESDLIVKEANYSVAAGRDADSLPPEMDAGPIREYRLRLEDLRRQLSEASATMTPEHYRVRELNNQIAETQDAIKKERDGLVNRLKAQVEDAQQQEAMISTAYQKEAAQASEADDKIVRYNMVLRDVDSERRLYETLLQKVGEVGLAAAMRTSTISIVDPAAAPARPYSPRTLADLGIGFLGGSILGLGVSFLRTRADRTLCSPGEAALHLQLRELGVIPSAKNRGFRVLLRRKPPDAITASRTEIEDAVEERPANPAAILMPRVPVRSVALATWFKLPEMSEAFYGTMNSLLFAGRETLGARVVVVTSPEDRDGKTTVSANLAIALAQVGRRVVLVDGDLRKPRLHTIFEERASGSASPEFPMSAGGLVQMLEENLPIQHYRLAQFVRETQVPNLSVVSTSPAREGIVSKLHSARMRLILERLRQDFDDVIIDSPPMLHISDARVLGWLADGVILVFRAGKTTKEAALAVHDCLVQDGIRVLGTVLNDWNPRKGERYGAYSSYSRAAS